jgi:hypothetical protein
MPARMRHATPNSPGRSRATCRLCSHLSKSIAWRPHERRRSNPPPRSSDKPAEAPCREQNRLARWALSHLQKWHFLALLAGVVDADLFLQKQLRSNPPCFQCHFLALGGFFTRIEPSQPGTTGVTPRRPRNQKLRDEGRHLARCPE